jgi:signal transduction histidine kinase
LRRLIVENIELKMSLDPSLGRVKVDPAQIEQILVNLAVNARDAMPAGGTLTIETGNVDLDERYIKNHPQIEAGRYALLAVSDTGHGIPTQTYAALWNQPGAVGVGIAGMRERLHQLGGRLEIESSPSGTTVRATLTVGTSRQQI